MNEHETRPCPYCYELCVRDWAPAPRGLARTGAFGCTGCGAHEITHKTTHLRDFFHPAEARTGWFLPSNHDG